MAFPSEMKAQAVALLILGHSCRRVQTELSEQFPGADIPHHTTIARWLQSLAEPHGRAAEAYWGALAQSVVEVLFNRMGEAETMPLMQLVKFTSRASDIYWAGRERRMRALA